MHQPRQARALWVGFAGLGRLDLPCYVPTMKFRFIRKTLVYEYAAMAETHLPALEAGAQWHIANPEVVQTVFRKDANRMLRFHGYLLRVGSAHGASHHRGGGAGAATKAIRIWPPVERAEQISLRRRS
jgi:hypothetical protein